MAIPPLPSDIDAAFIPALMQGSRELGANPLEVAAVLYSESSLMHTAAHHNPNTGAVNAVGINQFNPGSKVLAYGFPSVQAYLNSPTSVQFTRATMPFWKGEMERYGLSSISARDLYWLNYLPGLYVRNAPDNHVITRNPGWFNGFDYDGNGDVTAGEIQHRINLVLNGKSSRWLAIKANVQAAMSGGGGIAKGGIGSAIVGVGMLALSYYVFRGKIPV